MEDILYMGSLLISVPFGIYWMFTIGKRMAFEDFDEVEGLFGKFISLLYWLVLLLGIIFAVVCPVLNIVLTVGYIFVLLDKRIEHKTIASSEFKDISHRLTYRLPYPLDQEFNDIYDKYNDILKGDINTKLAKNRYECVVTILKEACDNDLFDSNMNKEFYKNIVEMLRAIDTLFNEIIVSIEEVKNVTNKNLEDYMNDKVKEFNNTTKSMQKDFKKMNTK